MKRLLCLTSFISLVFAFDVLYYHDDDFVSKMPTHDLALVEFFNPWCQKCQELDPVYLAAAKILKHNSPPIPLIKMDCHYFAEFCQKLGIRSHPTFKVYRNGKAEDYPGRVTQGDIVKIMNKLVGPASKELKTVATAEKVLAHHEYSVIGFFRDSESELAKIYRKVADALRLEIFFAHTTEQAVRDKYNYNNTSCADEETALGMMIDIVLFQPKIYQNEFEKPARVYNDDATVSKITAWIQKERSGDNLKLSSLGLCSERTEETAEKFKNPLVVVYYDVNFSTNEQNTIIWRNRVLKVAKKFHDEGKEVTFAISNHNTWVHELGMFGLTETINNRPKFTPREKPVVTAKDKRERKYVMSDEFSEENLEKFVNDLLDDKLEQNLKSQPIPTSNDKPVKVAVAKNFDEIVNDEDKDVLIQFYAPWCKRCTTFEPKYKRLAEKLKNEPKLTIAIMDAEANELLKPYEYAMFPVIYLAPKGKKKNPKRYTGELDVDDLIKFIAKESTNELEGYNRNGMLKKTML